MPKADQLLTLTTEIVAAFVTRNRVRPDELAGVIASTHAALAAGGAPEAAAEGKAPAKPTPAEIRRSIRPDGLVSFENGRTYKTLKRHLVLHGLTMQDYRRKWGLPDDYPSTAPSYSAQRATMARTAGLGRRSGPRDASG